MKEKTQNATTTLVLGGTGKTGPRALGREPRGFASYVRDTVATGVWGS